MTKEYGNLTITRNLKHPVAIICGGELGDKKIIIRIAEHLNGNIKLVISSPLTINVLRSELLDTSQVKCTDEELDIIYTPKFQGRNKRSPKDWSVEEILQHWDE